MNEINASLAAKITTLILPNFPPKLFEFFAKFSSLRQIVFVGHTIRISVPFVTLNAIKLRFRSDIHMVHFSNWSKAYSETNGDPRSWRLIDKHTIIPNPVFWDLIQQAQESMLNATDRRRFHWIFHSRFERGGALGLRVFGKVNALEKNTTRLRVLDYSRYHDNVDQTSPSEGVDVMGSLSKPDLYDVLSESKYFLYLLVSETGFLHKDMFPVSVLEAIMLGVRVVTLPVGPLVALFSKDNLVEFIPIEDDEVRSKLTDFNSEIYIHEFLEESFVHNVSSFISTLNDEDFTSERRRRMKLANTLFSKERFTDLWTQEIFTI